MSTDTSSRKQGEEGGLARAVEASAASPEARVITKGPPSLEIVHVNQAWSNLCGFSSDEALGQTCRILRGPASSFDSIRQIHKAVEERRSTTVRLINYTKARQPFHCELQMEPIVDGDGSVVHFLGRFQKLPSPPGSFLKAAHSHICSGFIVLMVSYF